MFVGDTNLMALQYFVCKIQLAAAHHNEHIL
jgi:hypothetical protein